jgi:DNA-binding transcriptional MerR regulator
VIRKGEGNMDGGNQDHILMNPSDVCTILNIKDPTLRKYALLLKKAGYVFYTNGQGKRGYSNTDVIVLKRFIEVKEKENVTVEQAAKQVMTWVRESSITVRDTEENKKDKIYNTAIKELTEKVDKQNELLEKQGELLEMLTKKLDLQQRYIDDKLEERDHKLTQHLLEVAGSKEEQNRKGFFQRLFGK